ncbi:hypothetical protein V1511DRAFT_522240 [Dipodascopsis uninucleata]
MTDPYNLHSQSAMIRFNGPSIDSHAEDSSRRDDYYELPANVGSAALTKNSSSDGSSSTRSYSSIFDTSDSASMTLSSTPNTSVMNAVYDSSLMSAAYNSMSSNDGACYDTNAICIDPIFADTNVISSNPVLQMNQSNYYATTNLFEAAAYGVREDPYLQLSIGGIHSGYHQPIYSGRVSSVNSADSTTKRQFGDHSFDQDDSNDSDEFNWSIHKRRGSIKRKPKDANPKTKSIQVRPHFMNDKAVIINPEKTMFWFIQTKNCQSMSVGIRRCRACTRRKSGVGACRFIGVRVFKEDVSGPHYDGEDPDYALSDQLNLILHPDNYYRNLHPRMEGYDGQYHYTKSLAKITFSEPPRSLEDVEYTMNHISYPFLRILEQELQLEMQSSLLRIVPKEGEGYRSLCDICGTSLFSGRHMCYYCGLEMCLDCYSDWNNLGEDSGKLVRNTLRFVFEFCAYGNRHQQSCFVPVSRMMPHELETIVNNLQQYMARNNQKIQSIDGIQNMDMNIQRNIRSASCYYDSDALSIDQFRHVWKQRLPLVIRGTRKNPRCDWSDIYFIHNHAIERCILTDGNTGEAVESALGTFFDGFKAGIYESSKTCMKLKDWPTNGDFRELYPSLFEDFELSLPFPCYTKREGYFNLVSMFSKEYNIPDLGPRMDVAYPSSHSENGKGTTNLHLDVADTCNIMMYAQPYRSDNLSNDENNIDILRGDEAIGAIWDIFRAEDCKKLRQFILDREQESPETYNNPFLAAKRDKAKGSKVVPKFSTDDPIHRQVFYLTDPELALLKQRFGIVPYRVWQGPGDSVMIPAGCPYQVCNISSCVKVTVNFVSPENVSHCMELLQEVRSLSRVKKKEDVLQLKQILHFAWMKSMDILSNWKNT